MLKYASQLRVGDRFYIKTDDFRNTSGTRLQSNKGWIYVIVERVIDPPLDTDTVNLVLVTEFNQRINANVPQTIAVDAVSEGSPASMGMLGDVHYGELASVLKSRS